MRNVACAAVLLVVLAGGCSRTEGGEATEAAPDTALSVLTLNIWHNQGNWPARRDLLIRELRALAPDVICLQEVLQNPELPNQARTLADSLGYHYYFASIDGPESEKRYGNAILSRHPITEEGWAALDPKDDYRTVAHARIQYRGLPIDVYNTHLHYSGESGGEDVRGTQIRDLLAFVDSTSAGGPVILAGDFNTPSGAPELALVTEQFNDAYAALHPQEEEGVTTLNPHHGHAPRRIDYIFFKQEGRLEPQAAEILFREATADSLWASDHFGVLTRFALAPAPQ